MEGWQTPVSERNDLLLFNDVFRPLKARTGFHCGLEADLVRRKFSAWAANSEAPTDGGEKGARARLMGRMPPREARGLLGRERFLKRLAKLMFDKGERLLKVYGAEGSGKTAVARELVHELKDRFPGGVIWLNGGTMVWDAYHVLVDDLGLQSYSNTLDVEQLQQRLWKYFYDNPDPWLLVIDDANDDALEWVPPLSMVRNGFVLVTAKAKSGRDESLRVELPLLTAKSLTDVVLRYAQLQKCKTKTVMAWTDSFHLCRNLLGVRLLGFLRSTYELSLEELLRRYDAAMQKSVMPDLGSILDRYTLRHHTADLRSVGVLNAMDFVRGRPWTALEGLSRKELYMFEKIQENLHRSRNRLSTKVLCKMWRDILATDADGASARAREVWDLLRASSCFSARYIPPDLLATELTAMEVDPASAGQYGDLIYFSGPPADRSLCVHATLLDAVRSIHQKNNDKNRALAKRALTNLHGYCMDSVFAADQKVVGIAECDDRAFRAVTMGVLPHVFLASGLVADLLLKGSSTGDEPVDRDALPEDFVAARLTRRHSLFSVASGGSAASAAAAAAFSESTRQPPSVLGGGSSSALRIAARTTRGQKPRTGTAAATAESKGDVEGEAHDDEDDEDEDVEEADQVHADQGGRRAGGGRVGVDGATLGEGPGADRRLEEELRVSSRDPTEAECEPEREAKPQQSPSDKIRERPRRSSAFVSGSGPLLKQITRRFTPRAKRSNPRVLLADLALVQGMLLMILQLGSFRIKQAETLFRKALQTYTKCDERSLVLSTKYLVGLCLFRCSRLGECIRMWEEVVDVASDAGQRAFTITSLAVAHAVATEPRKSIPLLEESLKQVGKDLVGARTYVALSNIYRSQGLLSESIASMDSAMAIYDDLCPLSFMSAEAHSFLGAAHHELGSEERALVHIEEAISIYSSTEARIIQLCEAHSRLGSLLQSIGRLEEAVDAYVRCLEQSDMLFGTIVDHPDNVQVIRSLADCYKRLGQEALAEQYADKARAMRKRLSAWGSAFSSLEL